MDWTLMGEPSPIATPPRLICLVCFRWIIYQYNCWDNWICQHILILLFASGVKQIMMRSLQDDWLLNLDFSPATIPIMNFLLSLIGVVLILEALPYVACPEAMQKWLRQLTTMDPGILRVLGLLAMGLGLLICYLTQRTDLI